MKCKELMVGDFCRSGHGLPMQITNVGDDYAYAAFEGNEGDTWEFNDKDEQPQPIEITYDLLEANGWKALVKKYGTTTCDFGRIYESNGNYLKWYKYGIKLYIWFDYRTNNSELLAEVVMPVKYVHQLQQVLRLAGMTELANNFKGQL